VHSLGLLEGRVVGVGDDTPLPVNSKAEFEAAVAKKSIVAVAVRRHVEPMISTSPSREEVPEDQAALVADLRAKGKREEVIEEHVQELRARKRKEARAAAAAAEEKIRQQEQSRGSVVPPCRVKLSGLTGELSKLNDRACVAERIEKTATKDDGAAAIVIVYVAGRIIKVPLSCCTPLAWEEKTWHMHSGDVDEFTNIGPLFFVPDEFALWRGAQRQAIRSTWHAFKTEGYKAAKDLWSISRSESKGAMAVARAEAKKAKEELHEEANKQKGQLKAEGQAVKEAAKLEAKNAKEEARELKRVAKQEAVAAKAEAKKKVWSWFLYCSSIMKAHDPTNLSRLSLAIDSTFLLHFLPILHSNLCVCPCVFQKEELKRELKAKTPQAKQALAAAQSAQSALAQRLKERKADGEKVAADGGTSEDVRAEAVASVVALPKSLQIKPFAIGNVPGSSI